VRRRVLLLLLVATAAIARAGPPASPLPPDAQTAADALRAAREALSRDAYADAVQRFTDAADAHPAIADHARRLAASALLDAGRAEPAEATARLALKQAPGSAVAAQLYDLVARARKALGDEPGARAAWQAALERARGFGQADAMHLALATSFERSGQLEDAAREARAVWVDSAERPEADAAGRQLAALEARAGRSFRGAPDWLRRADRLFDVQRSAAALEAYEAALGAGLAGEARRHATERRAHCLFRLRRYTEAVSAFAALAPDPTARVWHARALARSDRVEEGIAALEQIGREPLGETAAWARYLAGLLHAGRGRVDRARSLWISVVDAHASDGLVGDALWQLGWTAYTKGDYAEARTRLLARAPLERDPIERVAARYWAARALEHSDPKTARTELAGIARESPYSYYGWRAGQRAPAGAPTMPQPIEEGGTAITDRDLLPARILLAAGLEAEALAELAQLDARADGLRDHLSLGALHAAAGDWAGAQSLVVAAYGGRLEGGPAPGQESLWRLAWPQAWSAELRAALPPGASVTPALVSSVMREESRYRPDAVSVTGAVGLLQLMPDTAARQAPEVGLTGFEPDQLVQPAVNLRIGAHYLDALVRRFDGRLSAAIASYNAGPEAVSQWLAASPGADDEEWVESIPYGETRGYVKRVLRSANAYRMLYP